MFCLTHKRNLKLSTESPPRTHTEICTDAGRVAAAGATAKSKQDNHSVNEAPFFEIPIDHVCIIMIDIIRFMIE